MNEILSYKSVLDSVTDGFPTGFVRQMEDLLGDSADDFFQAMSETPSVSIRLNKRKPVKDLMSGDKEFGLRPVPWCEDGYYLSKRPVFTLNPLFHAGSFYVQDASSMIYQQIVRSILDTYYLDEFDSPLSVLDLCAAPGGKTTAIINALPDKTVVVANEIDSSRNAILRENLEKWGYPDLVLTNSDAVSLGKLEESFDIIAVDAPCSGEGMMRKDVDAVRQWSEKLIESCANTQREIMKNILPALIPGGFLIYSTCTFNREENERNVEYFIENYGLESVRLELQGVEKCLPAIDSGIHALRFMPHVVDGEGLFVTVLRKPVEDEENQTGEYGKWDRRTSRRKGTPSRKRKNGKENKDKKRTSDITEALKFLKGDGESWSVVERNGSIFAMSEDTARMSKRLQEVSRVILAGVPLASVKGNLILPDSKAVLYPLWNKDAFPFVELSRQEAIAYLRRESFALASDVPTGYVAVGHGGCLLGLVKNIGRRVNNLYPVGWRVRMEFR